MNFDFKKSFIKDVKKITDKSIINEIEKVVDSIEKAQKISDIPQIQKLKGTKYFYRIRIGYYRIGLEIINDYIIFYTVLPRKDIYKFFP